MAPRRTKGFRNWGENQFWIWFFLDPTDDVQTEVSTEGITQTYELISERPEVWESVKKTSTNVPAVVVDNSKKPLKVKLLVNGYENRILDLGGINNVDDYKVGSFLFVNVTGVTKKGIVHQVQYSSRTKP